MPQPRSRKTNRRVRPKNSVAQSPDWAIQIKRIPNDPPPVNQARFQRRTYQLAAPLVSGSLNISPVIFTGIVPANSLFYPHSIKAWVPATSTTATASVTLESTDGLKIMDQSAVGVGFAKAGFIFCHNVRIVPHNNQSTSIWATVSGTADPIVQICVDICLKV